MFVTAQSELEIKRVELKLLEEQYHAAVAEETDEACRGRLLSSLQRMIQRKQQEVRRLEESA